MAVFKRVKRLNYEKESLLTKQFTVGNFREIVIMNPEGEPELVNPKELIMMDNLERVFNSSDYRSDEVVAVKTDKYIILNKRVETKEDNRENSKIKNHRERLRIDLETGDIVYHEIYQLINCQYTLYVVDHDVKAKGDIIQSHMEYTELYTLGRDNESREKTLRELAMSMASTDLHVHLPELGGEIR